MAKIRVYDNTGETIDRYTAVYLDLPEKVFGFFSARGMSENPWLGFGQWCSAQDGDHLGKRISIMQLPEPARRLVMSDLAAMAV